MTTYMFTSQQIRRAVIAASTDSSRANLTQVQFVPRCDIVSARATDGCRLHSIHYRFPGSDPAEAFCLPVPALDLAASISDTVEVAPDVVVCPGFRIVCTGSRPHFPPLDDVIRALEETSRNWTASPAEIRKALRPHNGPVGITPEGVVAQKDGEVIVRAHYLRDALRAAAPERKSEIKIGWSGPLDPVQITSPGFLGIVMPMRA